MPQVNLSPLGGAASQFFDNNGVILSGGKIYTYAAGTTTPQATYTSTSGATPHANPIILDSAGRVPGGEIWLADNLIYKFVVETSAGSLLGTYDNIPGINDFNLNADAIEYDPPFTGAVTSGYTVADKLEQYVSVKDFGATGDGVTNDTTAVHAAFAYAESLNRAVYFPSGTYRVTSGYTQSTNYRDIMMYGEGRGNQNVISPYAGSYILLDNTDVNSFFYDLDGFGSVMVEDLNFRCAQIVKDRKFFKISSSSCTFKFESCNFSGVEKPINFEVGSYFQMGLISNVQFHSSGTIHSYVDGPGEGNRLRGTLLTINNVNHEGGTVDNTEKVICDLQAVREIQITNLLLEGALPYSGWTCLNFWNPFDTNWGRSDIAQINGLHIEYVGTTGPNTTIHVNGGVVQCYAYGSSPETVKVSNKGVFALYGFGFTGSGSASVGSYFNVADSDSLVILNDCSGIVPTFDNPNIICNNFIQVAQDAAIGNYFDAGVAGNTGSSELFRYDGGFNVTGGEVAVFAGTTYYASTDANYGRKLVFVPSANNVSFRFNTTSYAGLRAGDTIWVAAYFKLPTFGASNGKVGVTLHGAGGSGSEYFASFDSSYSGQVVKVCGRVMRLKTDPASSVGFSVGMITAADISAGNLEVLSAVMGAGNTFPRTFLPCYPSKILTYSSAAPISGSWAAGDIVKNSSPAVGQPTGWVCTVAGTPGTWVSEGNL